MAIVIELDEIMEDRGVSLNKLSHRVGITNVNLSGLRPARCELYDSRRSPPSAMRWNANQETY